MALQLTVWMFWSAVTIRLKSVKNIQKITKSMKMVAAAKYSRAERALKPARVYGTGALCTYTLHSDVGDLSRRLFSDGIFPECSYFVKE